MKQIMIIGCGGCGKTTLARKLAQRLNLPLIHLDRLYWCGNWQSVDRETFDMLLMKEVSKPEWIIDGNYNRTIPLRLSYCDTVIYMDYPRLLCLWGVLKRVFTNWGRSRSDMGGYCPERLDGDFLKTVWKFNPTNRRRYYQMLEEQQGKTIVILRSRRQTRRFLDSVGTIPSQKA